MNQALPRYRYHAAPGSYKAWLLTWPNKNGEYPMMEWTEISV